MMRTALLLLALCLAAAAHAAEPPPGLLTLDGRPAPALKLADMDGHTTDLEQLRGSWVLVHFWATWCGPCKKEMPTLQRMSAQIPATGLRVLLVNTAETDDEVFAFLPSVAPDMNTLMDRDGKATERWQPRGLPSSFLVDPQGRLRYLALGGREWDAAGYLAFLRGLAGRR
jgi:thiol-disulfide isomerase/thioredoxin